MKKLLLLLFISSISSSFTWAGQITISPDFSLHSNKYDFEKTKITQEINCQTNFSNCVEFCFTLDRHVQISDVRLSDHLLTFNVAIFGSCKDFDTANAKTQSRFAVGSICETSFSFDFPVFMEGQQYCTQRIVTMQVPVPDSLQGRAFTQKFQDHQVFAIELDASSIESWIPRVHTAIMDQLVRSQVSITKDLDYQKIFDQLRGGGSKLAISERLAEVAINLQDYSEIILTKMKDTLQHQMLMKFTREGAIDCGLPKFKNWIPITLEKNDSGVKISWNDDLLNGSHCEQFPILSEQPQLDECAEKVEKALTAEELTEELYFAVCENRVQEVAHWLVKGANPHGTLRSGTTPFNEAIRNDKREILRLFFRQGIDVNHVLIHGYTALMVAILNENPDLAAELLMNGAKVNLTNSNGETAQSLGPEQFAKAEEMFRKLCCKNPNDAEKTDSQLTELSIDSKTDASPLKEGVE